MMNRPAGGRQEMGSLGVPHGLHGRRGNHRQYASRNRRGDQRKGGRSVASVLLPSSAMPRSCRASGLSRRPSHGRHQGRATTQRSKESERGKGSRVRRRSDHRPRGLHATILYLNRRGLLPTSDRVSLRRQGSMNRRRRVRRLSVHQEVSFNVRVPRDVRNKKMRLPTCKSGRHRCRRVLRLSGRNRGQFHCFCRVMEVREGSRTYRNSYRGAHRRNDSNHLENVRTFGKFCCGRQKDR